ncbi:extradiol ring-cleavage dioxygenase (plasmid) [Pseudonocardia sp. EC080610-09]|uniref:DODA-type extradiol aromatic ring-opening family dioxygenase n=1 Tax=unclassified Pseudonocardia TaxID=2619320 RepID=UPI00070586C9|nr:MULTISPECIES: extradiol ring-cleavage dioxygenase [unclassified Pseudonocardia]ALL79311.1 extradiol ring-cleavage dioxygenase [Pseudonocardia sp. EC080610-09]ALL85282.1 extradiol ring-cleavage dioxygenase [Pseudonocardia sp. EC080619-01]
MSRSLGLGLTHYPLLAGTDANMANLLRWTLGDPDIPSAEKDVSTWSEQMRAEWSDDGGAAAAAEHRAALVANLAQCRKALDDFAPDVVVVWGDDQFENFREEVIPPFCVLAYSDLEVHPFGTQADRGLPNAWGLPSDTTFVLRGDVDGARQLTDDLIGAGFDMAYSYRKREESHFPHAILNTQIFLDYDNAGREFPYRILPITVNCYGQHAIARRGGLARFAEIADEQLDPVGPTPARCMALGAAVARSMGATGRRVAYVASSSWSHAFLNDKDWHLRPDTAADQRFYDALVAGDRTPWAEATGREIVDAGQHEMLNWFCLLGAMDELGLALRSSDIVTTEIFNSNKVFAVFDED